MAEGLLFEEGRFVLLMPDVLLHDIFTPFAFLVFFCQPQGLSTSLGAGQHTLRSLAQRTRLSTFPEPSCWLSCPEGGPGVVGCVIEALVLGHVLVHIHGILGLDLKEKAVSVRVEELVALSILRFELVVIEFVHHVLGEIQNAHAHIQRATEYQVALVDLNSCQIIVEDIGPSKCWAGNETPEYVLRTHQLHINPLPQVFSMVFPKTELFINLYRSFLKSLAAFFRSSVFIRMYGSIQELWSNRRARWTLVRRISRYVDSCRFR